MRPVIQMKTPAIEYPIQTQSHDCHHDSPPPTIMEDEIIQVFYNVSGRGQEFLGKTPLTILKESAIQKPTKFHAPH